MIRQRLLIGINGLQDQTKAGEIAMEPDIWVTVDGSRYGSGEVFQANRARRVFAIVEAHVNGGSIIQFLVVGDDGRFYNVFAGDCQVHKIDDEKGVFIDLA